jgi:hypothetical protein
MHSSKTPMNFYRTIRCQIPEHNIFILPAERTTNSAIKLVTYRICYSATENCNDNFVTSSIKWKHTVTLTWEWRHNTSRNAVSNCQAPLERLMTQLRKTSCCCPRSILLLKITVTITGDWSPTTPAPPTLLWSSSARFYSTQSQHNTPQKSYTVSSPLVWAVPQ